MEEKMSQEVKPPELKILKNKLMNIKFQYSPYFLDKKERL